jgi:hypothetical protein
MTKSRADRIREMLANIHFRTFRLLPKSAKVKIYTKLQFCLSFVWAWNLVSDIKTEGVWEQGAEENIWIVEVCSERSLEKTA